MSPTDISSALHSPSKELLKDLEPDSLTKECIHFASHRTCDDQRQPKNATDMLQLILVNHFTESQSEHHSANLPWLYGHELVN